MSLEGVREKYSESSRDNATHQNSWRYVHVSLVIDTTVILLSPTLTHYLTTRGFVTVADIVIETAIALAIWWAVAIGNNAYEDNSIRDIVDEAQFIARGGITSLLIFAGSTSIAGMSISQLFYLRMFVINIIGIFSLRMLARFLYRITKTSLVPSRRTVIVGTNQIANFTARLIQQTPGFDMPLVGFISDDWNSEGQYFGQLLGETANLEQIIERFDINRILIALPSEKHDQIAQIIRRASRYPVDIQIIPDFLSMKLYELTNFGSQGIKTIQDLALNNELTFDDVTFVDIRVPLLSQQQRIIKRVIDVVGSIFAIVVTFPLMVLIAVGIKLSSPGPILFKQKRVGENGKLFTIFKFRSMISAAEEKQHEVTKYADGHIIHKSEDDPRVTDFGRFIRRTSLDELPQLFNVLQGTMSLVGPRPELPWLVEQYELWELKRFSVPQGITGWWQVNGRATNLMHLNSSYDIYYIDHYSFWLDLRILLNTLPAILQGVGAF